MHLVEEDFRTRVTLRFPIGLTFASTWINHPSAATGCAELDASTNTTSDLLQPNLRLVLQIFF